MSTTLTLILNKIIKNFLQIIRHPLTHPHTWVSLVAPPKSQSKVFYIDVSTSQMQYLSLLESPQLLIWTLSKFSCCNSYFNRVSNATHMLTLTELQLLLQHDLEMPLVLLNVSKSESIQWNPLDLDLLAISMPVYLLSAIPLQGLHPI